MLGSLIGGGISLAGSLFGGGGGGLFGGGSKPKKSYLQRRSEELAAEELNRKNDFMSKYSDLYKSYYFPIEEMLAKDYMTDYGYARPFNERMRNYQLGRGDELIGLAKETNPLLDASKKDIIRRLTEGEDVLRDKMQTQASTDYQASFDSAKDQGMRQMSMYGINPNSGAFSGFMSNMTAQNALGQAGARTNAARQAEDLSLQRAIQAQSMYTNPNMMFNPSRPTPGMSAGGFMGGSVMGGGMGGGGGGGQGGMGGGDDFWSGIGSGVGGLINGFGDLFGGGGGSGGAGIGSIISGAGGGGVHSSGGIMGGADDILSGLFG